ncbi:MAG TPA: S41 family peptidase [Burkholderiaceae bacterium]|nr:S41 family peptidase [Burkholderiaceae bacterium]
MPAPDNAAFRRALPRHLLHSLAAAVVLSLSSCGGGGSSSAIPPSAEFQGRLLVTNGGANASDWDATTCTDARQKSWVRANLNEDYLFYREAPLTTIEPTTFAGTVPGLFAAYTTGALPQKDRFSFVISQAEADAVFEAGVSVGLGITFARDAKSKQIRIAFVDPNGPAFAAGLRRGMQLQSVNGATLAPAERPNFSDSQAAALFAGQPGDLVNIGFSTPPSTTETVFNLSTAKFAETPVLTAKVLDSAPGKVGYLAHNSFSTPIGELQLADAFKTFASAGVTDLVLDLRYNSGGFIFIASQLAYMIAGSTPTANKTFETFIYSDKRTAENRSEPFRNVITSFLQKERVGEPLSQLNLSRVFVLATGNTCSASEAVVNALRGVDVDVVMIGSTTCGKPYGFAKRDNCTLSYFPLEFEGRNQKGQVVPLSGLTPTASCESSDDLDHELGDPSERMLSLSISYMTRGACTATTGSASTKALGHPRKPGAPIEEQEFVPAHRTIQLLTPPR